MEVGLRGRSLELSRVRAMLKAREDLAKANPGGPASRAQESTRFVLQLDRVVLQRGSLVEVSVSVLKCLRIFRIEEAALAALVAAHAIVD